MNVANLERFIEWLEFVSKNEVDKTYIEETLKEVEMQYNNTGSTCYELSKLETKTGNPETYVYNVKTAIDNDEIVIVYVF